MNRRLDEAEADQKAPPPDPGLLTEPVGRAGVGEVGRQLAEAEEGHDGAGGDKEGADGGQPAHRGLQASPGPGR